MISMRFPMINSILFILLLIFATELSLPGCIPTSMTVKEPEVHSASQIKSEIIRLEKAVKIETSPRTKAKLLFNLALLYSHQKNPDPDYRKALSKLKEFSFLDPEGGKTVQVQYMSTLLHKIVELENKYNKAEAGIKGLRKTIKESKQNSEKLKNRCEELAKENQEIKKIIDKLTHLDIQLEKKRINIQ